MTDEEFLKQIRQYDPVIHKACNVYYRDYSRADLVQEIILELYKSLPNFRKDCTFKTWVYNVSRNVCINVLRREKKHRAIEGLDDYHEYIADEQITEKDIEQLHNAMRYNVVIDSLKEPDKTIFQMYLEGYRFKEIENHTGVNENALRVHIHRIKKKLQLRYGNYKNN